MNNKEVRYIEFTEIRAMDSNEEEGTTLSGYVAKFNEPSQFLGFYELIDEGAFDKTLERDNNIVALYNHDWSNVLGSTKNETLKLYVDDVGLKFELTPIAKTSTINDVVELVKSEEVTGVSFGFSVVEDSWTTKDDDDYRTLLDVELYEVSITVNPAYLSSDVSVRSHDEYKKTVEERKRKEQLKRKLLIELDI